MEPHDSYPLISVVIPCHNAEPYLRECLDSVFSQTYPRLEVVCINDGSSDGTRAILDSYGDRIVSADQRNGGASATRNAGVALSTGSIICFLDADDVLPSDSIMVRYHAMVKSGADVAYGEMLMTDEHGVPFSNVPLGLRGPGDDAVKALCGGMISPVGCTIITRKAFDRAGGFDTSMRGAEDYDFYFKVARSGAKFVMVPDIVLLYRKTPGSVTRHFGQVFLNAHDTLSRHVFRSGLFLRYPIAAFLGWSKIRHYFASGRFEAAQAGIGPPELASSRHILLRSPSLWFFVAAHPLLRRLKRAVGRRRALSRAVEAKEKGPAESG